MKNLLFLWFAFFSAAAIPLTVHGQVTTAEALDGPDLFWSRSGGAGVSIPADTHDGVDAYRTGTVGNPGTNFVRTTVTGPGTIDFWWKVSSEEGFDKFIFSSKGGNEEEIEPLLDEISGEVGWTPRSFLVPEGVQTLEWAYVKDDFATSGADRAWLDEVFYHPDPPSIIDQPIDTEAVVGMTVSFPITYRAPGPTSTLMPPKFFWQLSGTNLPGKTNATLTLTNVQVAQSGQYRVILTNVYGKATSEVAVLTIAQPVYLDVGLDTTGLVWNSDGDADWIGLAEDSTNSVTHDGIDSVRSGLPPEDFEQLSFESWILTTVTGPGTLKFWWRLTGLETDLFFLQVAGATMTNVPPDDETWQEEIVTVPPGSVTLKWTYLRDDFISTDDSDGAYLDQVRFYPPTNAPPKFSFPSLTTNGFSARIELDPYRVYTIQRSTNLTTWTNIVTYTNTESLFDFLDPSATNFDRRYYRFKSP